MKYTDKPNLIRVSRPAVVPKEVYPLISSIRCTRSRRTTLLLPDNSNPPQTSLEVQPLAINAPPPNTSTVEQEKSQLLLEEKEREIVCLKEMIEWLKLKV